MSTREKALELVSSAQAAIESASLVLAAGRRIVEPVGLTVDSSVLDASYQSSFLPSKFYDGLNRDPFSSLPSTNDHYRGSLGKDQYSNTKDSNTERQSMLNAFPKVLSTTGGHSNTDHVIKLTGDPRIDKISAYKRSLKRRAKSVRPEQRGSNRWDQPRFSRFSGGRRRRIMREKDLPSAPPEPPPSGYIVFIGQMTTKIRHDRPHIHHNQTRVVSEISKIWKRGMSKKDRNYYFTFAKEVKEEYQMLHREFRATGNYTRRDRKFEKLYGIGPWVRVNDDEKNTLEKEIDTYAYSTFPQRSIELEKPGWVDETKAP